MRIQYPGNPSKRSLEYEAFNYPAGEKQVRLKPETIPLIHAAESVEIDATAISPSTLFGLILLSDAIRDVKPGVELILNMPYLPYARADRRFVEGDCFGLETFGRLLHVGNFDKINALDVHNPGAAFTHVSSFLRNYPAMPFIQRAAEDFKPDAILFPDEGAAKRYAHTGFSEVYATKERDPATGKLSGFTVPDVSRYGRILIVDDICDGGGTFLGVTGAIPPGPAFGLYVTHGIFSKGVLELFNVFSHIYTTNSYMERAETKRLTVYNAFGAFHEA